MKRALLLSLLLCLPIFAYADDVAALIESYENPALGPAAKVTNLTIGVSNITIELNGSAAPVRAGKDVIGLFFAGTGKYTYRSTDPIETSIAMFEAKKASKIKAEKSGDTVVLTDTFSRMFLRTGGVQLPQLPEGTSQELDAAFKAHRENFSHARVAPASHLLIRQRLDKPSSPVARIEFDGDETTLYELDSIERKTESISSLLRIMEMPTNEMKNWLQPVVISEQPVGRGRTDFVDPPFLLTAIDYTLIGNLDETAKLSIDE